MGRGSGSARVGEERGGENGDGYGGCVCRVSDAKCFDQSVQSQGQP